MRRIVDRSGDEWDVVIGRESWGGVCALFVPVRRPGAPVLQAPLPSGDARVPELVLDAMPDDALDALLQRAVIKDT